MFLEKVDGSKAGSPTFRSRNHLNGRAGLEPSRRVVLHLLAELALAVDRVKGDEDPAFEEVFRRDGRMAHFGVHGVEDGREFRQHAVHDRLDVPDGVFSPDESGLGGQDGEHCRLAIGLPADGHPPTGLPYYISARRILLLFQHPANATILGTNPTFEARFSLA